jgi:Zn-finger nucleic acid-binding protein
MAASASFACPACSAALREFHGRLCCDACNGIWLEVGDLAVAIEQETGASLDLQFLDRGLGRRACPRCRQALIECRIDAYLGEKHGKLRTKLDRCPQHGIWFDADELAQVLATLRRTTAPPSHATLREIVETYVELQLESFGGRRR